MEGEKETEIRTREIPRQEASREEVRTKRSIYKKEKEKRRGDEEYHKEMQDTFGSDEEVTRDTKPEGGASTQKKSQSSGWDEDAFLREAEEENRRYNQRR